MAQTDLLIDRLTADLAPVRRLPRPWVRAGLWLAAAAALIGVQVAIQGLRPDLPLRLRDWGFWIDVACSLGGGVAAALAAFHLAQPGRSLWWAAAPAPFLALWIGGLLAESGGRMLFGDGLVFGTSWHCVQVIVQTSVPLVILALWMLKRAFPETPTLAACLGAVAAAFLTSGGLSLYHGLDSGVMVLVWHGGAAAAVTLAGALAGRRFL